jgi:drug/metabolite transporter (DMT)-like permease
MLALAIAVICSTSFSLIVRHTQRERQDQFAVMGLNYAAASATAFLCAGGQWQLSPPTWQIGGAGGLIFVSAYIFLIHSLDLKGVAIANAVTRLSVLIPVAASIALFGEEPRLLEIVGGGLAIIAMPLLSLDRGFTGSRLSRWERPFLLALFLLNGGCLLSTKWFHSTGLSAQRPLYFGVLFGVAAVVSLVAWLGWSRRGGRRELFWGVLLGVVNYVTGAALIRALDSLSGMVVFPVQAALGLVLTAVFAGWAWQEIPGRLGQAGLALAVVAVVMINL